MSLYILKNGKITEVTASDKRMYTFHFVKSSAPDVLRFSPLFPPMDNEQEQEWRTAKGNYLHVISDGPNQRISITDHEL